MPVCPRAAGRGPKSRGTEGINRGVLRVSSLHSIASSKEVLLSSLFGSTFLGGGTSGTLTFTKERPLYMGLPTPFPVPDVQAVLPLTTEVCGTRGGVPVELGKAVGESVGEFPSQDGRSGPVPGARFHPCVGDGHLLEEGSGRPGVSDPGRWESQEGYRREGDGLVVPVCPALEGGCRWEGDGRTWTVWGRGTSLQRDSN